MTARLYVLAGALAAGTLLADAARPSSILAVAPCLAIAIAIAGTSCKRRRAARASCAPARDVSRWRDFWMCGSAFVVALAVALSFALAGLRLRSLDRAALARGAARGADAVLLGRVLDDPVVANGALRFTLGVSRAEIDGHAMRVRERALVSMPAPDGSRGAPVAADFVRVDARLHPRTFAGMDANARASAQRLVYAGIAARATVQPGGVAILGHARDPLSLVADAGRAAVRRAAAAVPARDRGLLLGVTIGDTSLLDPGLAEDFRTTGLSHVVAVSGANVAFVLALVAFVLRGLRARRAAALIVMALALVSFMAVARFEPSVMRAGAMTGVTLAGLATGARRTATNALAASAIALQALDPFVIHATGFQLSALATLGLLVLSPRIAEMLPDGKLARAAAVSLGAQLAVAPLLALEFHQLSPVSVAANLLVVPAVAPATIAGMVAAVAGTAWRPLAKVALVAVAPIKWMRAIPPLLARLPFASVRTPAGILGALCGGALCVLAVAAARARRRPALFPVALSLALVATGGVWARALGPPPMRGLVVTMLNVGQGDAFVVRAGGRVMMIDGGPVASVTLRALRAEGVRRIDLLVLTHPHADHVDGLVAVARTIPVAHALDPYVESALPAYAELKRALRAVPRDRAVAGTSFALGPARIDVLWPPATHMTGTPADVNNNSIVLRVSYGADSVLFAGEVQEEAQAELLRRPTRLRAEVVKVAHHGSRHMLPAFYAATAARIALIPVGPNRFGHPALETLAALRGMRVLRTDRDGEVAVALDGAGHLADREHRAAA